MRPKRDPPRPEPPLVPAHGGGSLLGGPPVEGGLGGNTGRGGDRKRMSHKLSRGSEPL